MSFSSLVMSALESAQKCREMSELTLSVMICKTRFTVATWLYNGYKPSHLQESKC